MVSRTARQRLVADRLASRAIEDGLEDSVQAPLASSVLIGSAI